MDNIVRRKSKSSGPLSPIIVDGTACTPTGQHSLPMHSPDFTSSPEDFPKQYSKNGRIRMLKTSRQSFQKLLSDRRILMRILLFSLFFWKRYALRRQYHRYFVDYLTWKADTVEGSLWRGTLPSDQWKLGNNINDATIELVISHCDLPLDWIFEWAAPVKFEKITVISKCGKPVVGAPSNAKIVTLPNLGRCDQSYAHFLVEHYHDYYEEDSAGDDQKEKFIIFTKDNDNMNRFIVSRHRSIQEMIAISRKMGFACQEEQSWGYSPDHLLKICLPSAYMNWTAMAPYSRETYVRLPRDDNSEFPSRNGKTLQEYVLNLNIPVPESGLAPVCFGGNFMFNAKYIVQHPIDLWERIDKSLSRGNNIAEGHYMERLWAHLLSPPLEAAKVQDIRKQQDSSCQIEVYGAGVLTK